MQVALIAAASALLIRECASHQECIGNGECKHSYTKAVRILTYFSLVYLQCKMCNWTIVWLKPMDPLTVAIKFDDWQPQLRFYYYYYTIKLYKCNMYRVFDYAVVRIIALWICLQTNIKIIIFPYFKMLNLTNPKFHIIVSNTHPPERPKCQTLRYMTLD